MMVSQAVYFWVAAALTFFTAVLITLGRWKILLGLALFSVAQIFYITVRDHDRRK